MQSGRAKKGGVRQVTRSDTYSRRKVLKACETREGQKERGGGASEERTADGTRLETPGVERGGYVVLFGTHFL